MNTTEALRKLESDMRVIYAPGDYQGVVRGYRQRLSEILAAVEQAQSDTVPIETYNQALHELISERRNHEWAVKSTLSGQREGRVLVPKEPTPEMIDAGAQRLVSWEDGCVWPGSWDALQVAAARNEAERVWRSMTLASQPAPQGQDALDLLAHVYDNLADMPISEEWAHKTADRIYELLERTPEMQARRAALKTGEQP